MERRLLAWMGYRLGAQGCRESADVLWYVLRESAALVWAVYLGTATHRRRNLMAPLLLSDWKPKARAANDDLIDRMVNAIHMVVDMRAGDKDEDTITLSLAERIELMTGRLELTFNGHLEDE